VVHGRVIGDPYDGAALSDTQLAEEENLYSPTETAKGELLVVATTPGGWLRLVRFVEFDSGPVRVEPDEHRHVSAPGHRPDVLLDGAQLNERRVVDETVMRKFVGRRVTRDRDRYDLDKV
jgi:hypothetical protein